MTTNVEIPIDWIVHEVGQPQAVRVWADKLDLERRRDEAGREWVGAADAWRIIDEIRRAGREAAELHTAYEAYLNDWDRNQREAGEKAFQRILAEEHQRQASASLPESYAYLGNADLLGPGPRAHEFANSRAAEARAEWARKHPGMTFEQFERKWRKKR